MDHEALLRARINEEAFSIERTYFVKTDRQHNPKKVNPFRYFAGTLPVLVSAPHSVRHFRHKKIKPSDEFTGSIACILNNLTQCHSLVVTKLYGGDPNFDDPCLYKEALRTLAAEHHIEVLIDLHGAVRDHPFDLDIGTINGASLLNRPNLRASLKNALQRFGIAAISENHFSVSGQCTVTAFASRVLGIPAMQLEINKRFRAPHQNAQDFCRLVGALAEFINTVCR